MKYFRTKNGTIINEEYEIIPMDESSPLYKGYLDFVTNGNLVDTVEYLTPDEEIYNELSLETEKYKKRTQDGIDFYAKISAEFRLAKLYGKLTEETHEIIEKTLIPVRNEIIAGQWKSGLKELNILKPDSIGDDLFYSLNKSLSDYIDSNY